MTLIVGLRTHTRIQLLSDTRITHPDVTQVEEIPGRLKLVALSPSICVGFAGPAAPAIDRLRHTPMDARASFDLVVRHLLGESTCDFVVADSTSLRLASIQSSTVVEGDLVYAGDEDAWSAFLAARSRVPRPITPHSEPDPELDALSIVSGAFDAVLRDAAHPTVAGFKIRVGSRVDGFRYLYESRTFVQNVNGPINLSTAEHFGDAAAGGYSYTVLTPSDPGHAIVAVQMYQGRLGYVYAPLLHDQPIQIANVDHDGLCAYVRDHCGVNLDGLRVEGPSSWRTPGVGASLTTPKESNMKTCPFCAEKDLQDAAVVCKHCGRTLVATGLEQDVAVFLVPDWRRRLTFAVLAFIGLGAAGTAPVAPAFLVTVGIVALWLAVIIGVRTTPFIRYAGGLVFAAAVVTLIASLVGTR